MKFIRDLLDKIEPHFLPGGSQEKLYPIYEAQDTFLFTPGETATGTTHVRDSIDLKRLMITVVIALLPCVFMSMYNTGYQANRIIEAASNPANYDANKDEYVTKNELPLLSKAESELAEKDQMPSLRSFFGEMDTNGDKRLDKAECEAATTSGLMLDGVRPNKWTLKGARYKIMDAVGVKYDKAGSFGGNFLNPKLLLFCLFHGALYFLPVYIVCMAVGGHAELIFSIVRKHEINEGFLVTGLLFPLTLPPTIPLWQVAVGIIFGVVIGKEIFGGTGKNFLNPALTARAFLYFAYPLQISGSKTWAAVDGYSGATVLGGLADAKVDPVAVASGADIKQLAVERTGEVLSNSSVSFNGSTIITDNLEQSASWLNFFIGNVHGSMGETSTLCCLLGAMVLIATGIGSWRIMAGCVLGLVGLSALICTIGGEGILFNVPAHWHLVIGGFAFGTVFMATDPVSASMTSQGKWIYGILIGCVTVMVRVINPAFPEGIMLAILFGNVCAPLIDYWVVSQNIKRRMARNEA